MSNVAFEQDQGDELGLRVDIVEMLFGLVSGRDPLSEVQDKLIASLKSRLPGGDVAAAIPYIHATLVALAKGELRFNDVNDAMFKAISVAPKGCDHVVRSLID